MISVIMPVYKAKKYICEAVESILNQSYSDLELLLIDDCGNDGSIDIVKDKYSDKRIKCFKNEKNMGIAYSRNRGLEEASGEFIALLDDDDIAPLNRFELEMNYFKEHPEIDAIGGRYYTIDENGTITGFSNDTFQNPKFIKANLMFLDPLVNGSMMFRREVVIQNKIRYQDGCYGMEDYLFWIDFSQFGTITNLKDFLLYWRNVQGNETTRSRNELKEQRRAKFAEIQKYAIKKNGFVLPEDELDALTQMLPEGRLYDVVSKEDLQMLYHALHSIVEQAKDRELDYYTEINYACKKQFSRRLESSEYWYL